MKPNITNASSLNIGAILKNYIDTNRIFKSALARKIKKADSTIIRYQKSSTLQTSIIWELSHALKYNFFAEIATLLPTEYNSPKTEQIINNIQAITELQKEIERLTIENNLLKTIVSK